MSDTPSTGDGGANEDAGGNESAKDSGGAGGPDAVLADLASERKARQAAERTNQTLLTRLGKLEEASKSEHEKALEKARKEGWDEGSKAASSKANSRIVSAEVKRLAAEKFVDVSDAASALDISQFSVDDKGDFDERAINRELDRLLQQKPHWAKNGSGHGSADQGARGTAPTGTDMNTLIRERMRR
jgi:hypothetical protein